MAKTFKFKGYSGSVEVSPEDGVLHGKLLFIKDLVTYEAETVPKLQSAFEEAVDDYLATCEQLGKKPETTCNGTFNVRLSPQLHRDLALRAANEGRGLNDVVKAACNAYLDRRKPTLVRHQHEHKYVAMGYVVPSQQRALGHPDKRKPTWVSSITVQSKTRSQTKAH